MKKAFSILLLLSLVIGVQAQRGKKPVAKAKPVAVASPGLKLFKSMLPATAKVMFVDSVVVDKDDFLRHVPLNAESGLLKTVNPKEDFGNQLGLYQSELGDRQVYATGDSTMTELSTKTKLGDEWSKGAVIADFNHALYQMQNYPFLAADGVTLYFSAEGSESMGGKDIFMSSFDSDEAAWYKPQNIGLPFNSTANDYLLAIDDLDTLGWLVTDRRQPEGKVCIYTFVPTQTRQNFDDDDLDDNELMPYARIMSIKSTWEFGNREAAIARRDNMLRRMQQKSKGASTMRFVVNDDNVVTDLSQFKSDESRKLYAQVTELRQMLAKTSRQLESQRKVWHDGNKGLASQILNLEKQEEQQLTDIRNLENKIRKAESR